MLSAHVAPARAWHTVDGIALASLGIWLATGAPPWRKTLGYLVVGAAGLCKQNFLVVAPCALLALGDWRRPRHWLAVGTPGALYVLVVTALGGGPDLVAQLGAQRDLVARGLVPYASSRTILGLVLGALVGWLPHLARRRGVRVPSRWSMLAPGLVALAPLGLFTTAISGSYAHYARVSAFVLFGVALGRTSALIADRNRTAARAAFLVLTLAWASSVSLGYATPAYASGMLAALILLLDYPASPSARAGRWIPLACLTAVTAVAFVAARTQVVYREQAAARLDRPLGDVFAGGAGIRTNSQHGRVPRRPRPGGKFRPHARAAVRHRARPPRPLGDLPPAESAPHRLAPVHRAGRAGLGGACDAKPGGTARRRARARTEGAGRPARDGAGAPHGRRDLPPRGDDPRHPDEDRRDRVLRDLRMTRWPW